VPPTVVPRDGEPEGLLEPERLMVTDDTKVTVEGSAVTVCGIAVTVVG
jgi:hypothetical protein